MSCYASTLVVNPHTATCFSVKYKSILHDGIIYARERQPFLELKRTSVALGRMGSVSGRTWLIARKVDGGKVFKKMIHL
jgi:hypothetical protein